MKDLLNALNAIMKEQPQTMMGEVVVDTMDTLSPVFDTLFRDSRGELFVFSQKTQKKLPITELGENELYTLYVFVDANKHTFKFRDTLLVVTSVDDMNWHIEPKEIRQGDETVGMIGIAVVEKMEEKELRSVVLISPDGTYCNLTMYGSDSKEEVKTAYKDLMAIGDSIKEIMFKLLPEE